MGAFGEIWGWGWAFLFHLRILKYARYYPTVGRFLEEPSSLLVRPLTTTANQAFHPRGNIEIGINRRPGALTIDSLQRPWGLHVVRSGSDELGEDIFEPFTAPGHTRGVFFDVAPPPPFCRVLCQVPGECSGCGFRRCLWQGLWCLSMVGARVADRERGGKKLTRFQDLPLKAKARIWR